MFFVFILDFHTTQTHRHTNSHNIGMNVLQAFIPQEYSISHLLTAWTKKKKKSNIEELMVDVWVVDQWKEKLIGFRNIKLAFFFLVCLFWWMPQSRHISLARCMCTKRPQLKYESILYCWMLPSKLSANRQKPQSVRIVRMHHQCIEANGAVQNPYLFKASTAHIE